MMNPQVLFVLLFTGLCNAQNILFNLVSSLYEATSNSDEQLVKDTSVFKEEYDFIVIGAGSGGCVVTNRLTEVPQWDVLLLEAGRDEMFVTDVPLSAVVLGQTDYNWGYKAEKTTYSCLGLKQGQCNWPKGKAMGGTSVINLMVHNRGNRLDYDKWGINNSGWSYKEILPYFIKSERIVDIDDIYEEYHGRNGYLNVEYARYTTPLLKQFYKSAEEFGYNVTDVNGGHQLGFSRVQANLRNGRRCSASKAYIRPIRNRPNLQVAKEARVTKLLIDPATKKAFGVEFVKNRIRRRIRAKKEIILSAGTLNTPQLLMLSGIGPKEHLEDLKIDVIQDIKVGYNLQDHVSFNGLTFLVNDSITVSDRKVENFFDMYEYLINNRGPYTLPGGAEGIAFLKSKYSINKSDDYPDIEIVMGAGALNGDRRGGIRSLIGIPDSFYDTVYRNVKDKEAFSLNPVLLQCKSRGRVMLKSKDPFRWPLLHANFLQDDEDVKVLVEGIRMPESAGMASNAMKSLIRGPS